MDSGGDEQFPVLLAVGVSGHDIEEIGDVRADVRVGGDQPMSVYILAVEGCSFRCRCARSGNPSGSRRTTRQSLACIFMPTSRRLR